MNKKKIIISLVVVIFIIGSVIGYMTYNKNKDKQFIDSYYETLTLLHDGALTESVLCAKCTQVAEFGALRDMSYTDAYIASSVNLQTDIANLSVDADKKERQIVDYMNKIQKHPSKYNDNYKDILDLYDKYNALYNRLNKPKDYNPEDNSIKLISDITDEITKLSKLKID